MQCEEATKGIPPRPRAKMNERDCSGAARGPGKAISLVLGVKPLAVRESRLRRHRNEWAEVALSGPEIASRRPLAVSPLCPKKATRFAWQRTGSSCLPAGKRPMPGVRDNLDTGC